MTFPTVVQPTMAIKYVNPNTCAAVEVWTVCCEVYGTVHYEAINVYGVVVEADKDFNVLLSLLKLKGFTSSHVSCL